MPPKVPVPIPLVWSLFLSSTVRDLKDYRLDVRDACLHKAETACFLSEEDWSGGWDDTVAKCEQRVHAADAFLLILGYWYGSVPPGSDRSITHLEFDAAQKKWPSGFPPIAVLTPAPRSDAARELRQAAMKLLGRKKREAIAAHRRQLGAFRTAVSGTWRTVIPFKNKTDLREFAIARCWEWKGRTLLAAAQASVSAPAPAAEPQVADEQLGAIGREPQLRAVRATLAALADRAEVPAVALLVHGDEDAGQRAFAQRIVATALRNYLPRRRIHRLPVECADPAVLSSWVGQALGIADTGGFQAPEQLAARVATALKTQPLYFCLDRIGDLTGGVEGFRDRFWTPLVRELTVLRAAHGLAHRLVALLVDYSADLTPLASSTTAWAAPGALDYTRVIRMPSLEAFTRDQLLAWFADLDVPDEPAGRRAALATRALNGAAGADPVPARVFDRLRSEVLWPEGDRE